MENVNSLGAYLRSVSRAAGFRDLRPRIRNVFQGGDEEVSEEGGNRNDQEESAQLNSGPEVGAIGSDNASRSNDQQEQGERTPLLENGKGSTHQERSDLSPLRSKLVSSAQQRVEQLQRQRDECGSQLKDDGREHLLIVKVQRDDGTEAEVIVGQSTLPQTLFNSSNTLIGVGILSLPLAFRYAGWILGFIMLMASAVITKYTAGLLAKCLDVDSSLANFADIAYVAFGRGGRAATSTFITLELLVANVGLVILFADSLGSLIDGPDDVHWKILCGCVLLPLNFLPMRWLGTTSFMGIFCNATIIVIALVAGLLKAESPGSLRDVATTYAFPQHWKALPLSFGLIMALWTGHSVFPNIYRDMRHPAKYGGGLNLVFTFVTATDVMIAVVGYLLYGDSLLGEVTTNMLKTEGYSRALKVSILVFIAIVPLTKFPLFAAPIISTLEVAFRVDPRAALLKPNRFNQSKTLSWVLKALFRVLVTLVAVVIAILVPSFELISALMGGLFGFLICIILPMAFHLKMFHGQISKRQAVLDWTAIVVSMILGIVGTVWEFLPRRWMGLS